MENLTHLIHAINKKVPAAADMKNHEMELSVTEEGVELQQPKIAGQIKKALIETLSEASAGDCYFLLQYLIALEHHKATTVGLLATDMQEAIEEHADKFFKIEFVQTHLGWIAKQKPLSERDDLDDDDDDE